MPIELALPFFIRLLAFFYTPNKGVWDSVRRQRNKNSPLAGPERRATRFTSLRPRSVVVSAIPGAPALRCYGLAAHAVASGATAGTICRGIADQSTVLAASHLDIALRRCSHAVRHVHGATVAGTQGRTEATRNPCDVDRLLVASAGASRGVLVMPSKRGCTAISYNSSLSIPASG